MGRWNSLRVETWRDIMEWNTRNYGDKVAIIDPDHDKRETFKELNDRVNSLANALVGLGVVKGDRVCVLASSIPQYLEIACTAKAGLACVPLNYRLKGEEMAYIINDSGASTIFVEEPYLEVIRSMRHLIPNVKHYICIDASPDDMLSYEELVSSNSSDDPCVDVFEDDLLGIIYTSGTTGLPKGVIKKHKDTLRYLRLLRATSASAADDRCLSMWPLFHAGLFHSNFGILMWGNTQVLMRMYDPERAMQLIEKEKITWIAGVPTMIIRIMEHPNRTKYDLSTLLLVVYTGSPMPVEAIKKAMDVFGPILYQAFGMTEGTGETILSVDDHRKALSEPGKEYILSSVGKPLPGCEMRLVDDDDNDVPPGEPGEIVFRSDCLIEGYWNEPEETAELLRNGWMHTGDIGRLDEEGYLYIVDRKKDIIVSGGENISSKEIEEVVYAHPTVLECAVIGVPSDKWGEEVKAVVVLKRGMTATPEEIVDFCGERLGGFKKPKSVEIWDELPKNPGGKILKREMREKFWGGHEKRVH